MGIPRQIIPLRPFSIGFTLKRLKNAKELEQHFFKQQKTKCVNKVSLFRLFILVLQRNSGLSLTCFIQRTVIRSINPDICEKIYNSDFSSNSVGFRFWTPCHKAALHPKCDSTCSNEVNPPCAKVLLHKTLVTPHSRRGTTRHLSCWDYTYKTADDTIESSAVFLICACDHIGASRQRYLSRIFRCSTLQKMSVIVQEVMV